MRFHLIALFLLLLFMPITSWAQTSSVDDQDFVPLHVGSVAPIFSENDIFGKQTIALSDYRGKVVLLNFWATWCPPCREEIPAFEALQNKYKSALVVVGVSVFCSNTATENFYRDYKINYPVIYGYYELMGKYSKVASIPTTFLIDKEGRVTARIIGSRTEAEYERLLQPLLAR
jgi:cytochrome c biogenesis protein CcmG, thiol:disulfide interchange protein DsbE